MKFVEALEKAYDKDVETSGPVFAHRNVLTSDEMKVAVKIWNAVAFALAEKGLDDFIIISNGSLVSIPLEKEKAEDEPDETKTDKIKGKGKSPKTETAQNDAVNVKEKPEKENPESAEPVK